MISALTMTPYIVAAQGEEYAVKDPEAFFEGLTPEVSRAVLDACKRHLAMITCPLLVPEDRKSHQETVDGLRRTITRLQA